MVITLWQIWVVLGIVFAVIEIFTPSFFSLNLALACLPAAIAAYFGLDLTFQIIIFGVFSGVLIQLIRPMLLKHKKEKEDEFKSKYIGQEAKALMRITQTQGRISVFDEEWNARACYADEDIPEGRIVQIKKIDGLTMYVDNFIDDTGLEYEMHDGDLHPGAEDLFPEDKG